MSLNKETGLTYRDAGVDIDAGNAAVALIKDHVRSTYRPEVVGDIGGFGGLFALNTGKYRQPVLVSGTDGVGTKLKIAFLLDKHDTIGQDAVAMCVNDILVQGAEPLFFLDYLAVGKLEPAKVAAIVAGIAKACRESGCALIGGETAEMAGFYPDGEYDIAGFAVGVAERERLITGEKIRPGDVLIGLPSSGLHSNGYSLARKICFDVKGFAPDVYIPELGRTLGEELLTPTRLYPRVCLPLLERFDIRGMVHITGGGFYDNIPRVLPAGCAVEIDAGAWPMPPIFACLQAWGQVAWPEMYRTFNMGIGLILIVPAHEADAVRDDLAARGEACYVIGRVVAGNGEVVLKGGVFGE
ncbi:phosphoribosylformylglycinamidine cyclo-ligase [Sporolituus thermophilus]|uniref:Phosphoribosylformylglycinamidine cyclo-ligase n=1 Tax=Sporolituus thermophilus DSM 23256 TaxID=1123285 RepID=A0A1G7N6T7_9FIRM|nr:phosphoribosylformylglycinamidine cyclo-ligase [Sporolituus thermophilus]SDF69662.1 phosphoribosylformylglycinamidine cyclo-ligase [Sporolituus thermophilus DSM 23256]